MIIIITIKKNYKNYNLFWIHNKIIKLINNNKYLNKYLHYYYIEIKVNN